MGPLYTIQRQSMTGISPKSWRQILFKVSGYGDVGTVGPHTFIMSHVQVCNVRYFSQEWIFHKVTNTGLIQCTQLKMPD